MEHQPSACGVELTGPRSITVRGVKVPAWFICRDGQRFEFDSIGVLDANDNFSMSQLAPGQCVLYPGAIYQKKDPA